MKKSHKLLIANAMIALEEASSALRAVPKTYEVRCLLEDEAVVQLRELLLERVEDEWRARARKAAR